MQLILARGLGFQLIDSQVLRALFPALVELTAEIQSYATLLVLQVWLTLGFLVLHSLGTSRSAQCAPIPWRPDICFNLRFRPWYDSAFQSSYRFHFKFTTF